MPWACRSARRSPGSIARPARCAPSSRPMRAPHGSRKDRWHERNPRRRSPPRHLVRRRRGRDGSRRPRRGDRPCHRDDAAPARLALARPLAARAPAGSRWPSAWSRWPPCCSRWRSPRSSWLGSRPRVPPPFGPARPGLFAMGIDGDIVTTSQDGTRAAGADHRRSHRTPTPRSHATARSSRSGRGHRIRTAPTLVVMDADGSGRHSIATVTLRGQLRTTTRSRGLRTAASSRTRVSDVNKSQVFVASTDGERRLAGRRPGAQGRASQHGRRTAR